MDTTIISPPPATSTNYYPLPNRQRAANAAFAPKRTDAVFGSADFINILQGISNSISQQSTFPGVSDVLDLSPEAQGLLDFYTGVSSAIIGNEIIEGDGFILTEAQQTQVSDIIAARKDEPFTPQTRAAIMDDLARAGLSPQQLAIREQASEFSLSRIFLRALDNQPYSNGFLTSDSRAAQANIAAYNNQIFNEWARISTRFNPMVVANFIENPDARRRYNE